MAHADSAVEESGFNGVELALLSNRLDGIVKKMANTLLRTGRSGVPMASSAPVSAI